MDVPGVQYPVSDRSQIGGYLEGHESAVDEDRKVGLGLTFYILTDVILAIFFIGTYIFLRGYDNNLRWFPAGTAQPPYVVGFWVMIICVASAVCFVLADRIAAANQTLFRVLTAVAFLLALADLVYQIYVMGHLPFTPQDGAFATAYILLSGYHVYHMLLASFLGLGITVRGFRGIYSASQVKELYATNTGGHGHPAEEPPLQVKTPLRITTYYFIWAAVYAIAFWLLVIIQPPTHP